MSQPWWLTHVNSEKTTAFFFSLDKLRLLNIVVGNSYFQEKLWLIRPFDSEFFIIICRMSI